MNKYITGYSNFRGFVDHNHHIAMVQFRESFNKDGYSLSPLHYPDGHSFHEPITYLMRLVKNKPVKIAKISWKRHPEVLFDLFPRNMRINKNI